MPRRRRSLNAVVGFLAGGVAILAQIRLGLPTSKNIVLGGLLVGGLVFVGLNRLR